MDVFFQDYKINWGKNFGKPSDFFSYKDVKELNFKFIENKGHKIQLLVEDLEAIALKNNMDKH